MGCGATRKSKKVVEPKFAYVPTFGKEEVVEKIIEGVEQENEVLEKLSVATEEEYQDVGYQMLVLDKGGSAQQA